MLILAAKKVVNFVKTTGAKIVKVATEIYSTGLKVASKFVQVIPGIGKPISKAMDLVSKGVNAISNKALKNVKLDGKLGKAMGVFNKVNKYAGYASLGP